MSTTRAPIRGLRPLIALAVVLLACILIVLIADRSSQNARSRAGTGSGVAF